MARAAEILTGRYTLVVTNVPFLARGKQGPRLRKFAETHHGDAKGDIATVFASRIFRWLGDHGTQALVTPQNWLFLTTYRKLRERLLKGTGRGMWWRGWGPRRSRRSAVKSSTLRWSCCRRGSRGRIGRWRGWMCRLRGGSRRFGPPRRQGCWNVGRTVIESIQADQLKNPDAGGPDATGGRRGPLCWEIVAALVFYGIRRPGMTPKLTRIILGTPRGLAAH